MKITVYCGSNPGKEAIYTEAAKAVGRWIAINGHTLVYGGGAGGLMGILADEVLRNEGEVIGVLTTVLRGQEIPHPHLTELHEVETMARRKDVLYNLGDAYLALPGGPGTLEEIADIISWARSNLHDKPVALYNVNHYYDHLEAHYDQMVTQEFITQAMRDRFLFSDSLDEISQYIRH